MAADFFLGESLVGDGNEVAHIDLIIGSKSGPAGAAFLVCTFSHTVYCAKASANDNAPLPSLLRKINA